ncbi:MAG: hypothetical protein QOF59_418, partial [Actinomycetota bacterium]|nr:hypothetical protein [Actinomycetota bacterium]
ILGARSRSARAVSITALVAVVAADGAFWRLAGVARLGWGPKVALVGALLLCAGAWIPDAWLGTTQPGRVRSHLAGL